MRIAIIGGGTIGLFLAWKLRQKKEEVVVFEKKSKIGKEVCSGLFSKRILKFIPQSEKLIENRINSCLIHFPKKTLRVKFSQEFFVMNHQRLDELLAELAEKEKAEIFLNKEVLIEEIDFLKKKFDRIIGSDGALSATRKYLKLKNPYFRVGLQYIFFEKNNSSFVETWPTNSGFIWKIPRGQKLEYGIIEETKEARKLFLEFLQKKKIPYQPEMIKSAIIPQGLISTKNQKIALCGEALGLTKPWSGGGVIWGLIAAKLLLKYFPDFLKYQKALKNYFLPKLLFSQIAKRSLYFLGFRFPWLIPRNYKIESDFLI